MAEQAIVLATNIQDLYIQLARDVKYSKIKTANYINKKRIEGPYFKEEDKVYLLYKHIKTKRPSTKLDFKKLELFRIEEVVELVNYRLKLPTNSRLHLVFYVSLLEPAQGNTPVVTDINI
jgi:hypothetical protein